MVFKLFNKKEKQPKRDYQYLTNELEKETEKLIYELETNGIRFLINKMSCDEDYSGLIAERRKISMSFSSEDSVSWYAYRQSDKLNAPSDKPELLQLLSDPEYTGLKKYIYCCLSSLCSNTNDRDLFNFLIEKIQEEDDESTIVSILSRLRDIKKDSTYNIEPIKKLVLEDTYQVSHAAINALSFATDHEVEDLLLNEFKIADRHMQGMICGPLGTIATLKSIPALKEVHKKTRDHFLRSVIERAIYEIELTEKRHQ